MTSFTDTLKLSYKLPIASYNMGANDAWFEKGIWQKEWANGLLHVLVVPIALVYGKMITKSSIRDAANMVVQVYYRWER